MDQLFALDMQKDTIVHAIHSVTLDPTNTNTTVTIDGITDTMVNGVDLGVGGYLDIGLIDTMEDLIVNFIGAAVFSVIGFLYVRSRGKSTVLSRFIPYRKHGRTIEDWNNPANEPAGMTRTRMSWPNRLMRPSTLWNRIHAHRRGTEE